MDVCRSDQRHATIASFRSNPALLKCAKRLGDHPSGSTGDPETRISESGVVGWRGMFDFDWTVTDSRAEDDLGAVLAGTMRRG